MVHTMKNDRHPMEATEDSVGIMKSLKNADDLTKGRQKRERTIKMPR